MGQKGGSEDPTRALTSLCFALTLLFAVQIRRTWTADTRFPRNSALRHLIGDGDKSKIFSLVALPLRYCNAVKRQGPRQA